MFDNATGVRLVVAKHDADIHVWSEELSEPICQSIVFTLRKRRAVSSGRQSGRELVGGGEDGRPYSRPCTG